MTRDLGAAARRRRDFACQWRAEVEAAQRLGAASGRPLPRGALRGARRRRRVGSFGAICCVRGPAIRAGNARITQATSTSRRSRTSRASCSRRRRAARLAAADVPGGRRPRSSDVAGDLLGELGYESRERADGAAGTAQACVYGARQRPGARRASRCGVRRFGGGVTRPSLTSSLPAVFACRSSRICGAAPPCHAIDDPVQREVVVPVGAIPG